MDLGRLLCFGFDGFEAPDSLLFALDHDRVGAVILFERNCRDATQIRSLCSRLREAGGAELWILVDQEGGRVRRIKEPDIGPPPAGTLAGATPAEVESAYHESAQALAKLGIDFNLAPVADVLCHADNAVLADRALGGSVETVAPRVAAAVAGIQSAGLKACAKHFPGLGDVYTDPHHGTTRCTATVQTFRTVHFEPFGAAIRAGVTAVMTTHLLAPELDSKCIATYSARIVDEFLRDELAFRHLILTDDLEMGAVPDSPPEAAWYAFEAGHHLLLLCHDHEQQTAALDLFRTRLAGDGEARRRLHRALDRQEPYRRPFAYAFV